MIPVNDPTYKSSFSAKGGVQLNGRWLMKEVLKDIRDSILRNPYMTANDVYKVLPVGKNQATKMFNDLYAELEEKGVKLFQSRPRTIPTREFKRRYL